MSGGSDSSLDAIMIISAQDKSDTPAEDPARVPKRGDGKQAINNKYRTNPIDMTADTFAEAIKNKKYKKDECWINALFDVYGENLLSPTKNKRYVITRETILQVIGKTEENIKEGLVWEDILPFFVKYKLRARVFDQFHKLKHSYDPPVLNMENPVFYCMYDDTHVYTLNHDLKSLNQKQDDQVDEFRVYASNDYYIDEKRKPTKHLMIEDIDEILKIMREVLDIAEDTSEEDDTEKKKRYITDLVHMHDDLEELLWQLYDRGYEPKIRFQAGKITHIEIVVGDDNKTFILRGQQLNPEEIDGMILVNQEDVFNRTNEAMVDFQNQLLKKDHRSYYSKQDIDILDEYRTVANVGMLVDIDAQNRKLGKKQLDKYIKISELIELDMSKAYTAAFMKIQHIPIFNEFDIWKKYDQEPIRPLSLYQVERKDGNLFYNKNISLVYGRFLKSADMENIVAVKVPSMVRKVSYKKMINELWKTKLSPKPEEDKTLKKEIANTNFGMLEKSFNKNQKSTIFSSYGVAKYYQAIYGGHITTLTQFKEVETIILIH